MHVSNIWKLNTRLICGLMGACSILSVDASDVPDVCRNDGLRALSWDFARACDVAIDLENTINHKQGLLAAIDRQYNSYRRQLDVLSDQIDAARSKAADLANTVERYRSTISEQSARAADLSIAEKKWKDILESTRQLKGTTEAEFSKYKDSVRKVIGKLEQQYAAIDNVAGTELLGDAGDAFLKGLQSLGVDTNVSVGRFESDFFLSFNPVTGTIWIEAQLPGGAKFSLDDFEALLSGNFTIPAFDPVEVMLNEVPLSKSVERDWVDWSETSSNDENLGRYVSSRRFSDYFGADQLGSDTVSAVISGGASAEGAINRARSQLVMEWADFLVWAREFGQNKAVEGSSALFMNLIRQEFNESYSMPAIDANIQRIDYVYSINLDLSRVVPVLRDVVQAKVSTSKVGSFNIPHIGFEVKVTDQVPPSPKELADKLFSADFDKIDPVAEVTNAALGDRLSEEELNWLTQLDPKDIGRTLDHSTSLFDDFTSKLQSHGGRISQVVQDTVEEVQGTVDEGYIVFLENTALMDVMNETLQEIFRPTQLQVNLGTLNVDLRTGEVYCAGKLKFPISPASFAKLLHEFGDREQKKSLLSSRINGWKAVLNGESYDFTSLAGQGNFSEVAKAISSYNLRISDYTTKLTHAGEQLPLVGGQLRSVNEVLSTNKERLDGLLHQLDDARESVNRYVGDYNDVQRRLNQAADQFNNLNREINGLIERFNSMRFRVPQRPEDIPNTIIDSTKRDGRGCFGLC